MQKRTSFNVQPPAPILLSRDKQQTLDFKRLKKNSPDPDSDVISESFSASDDGFAQPSTASRRFRTGNFEVSSSSVFQAVKSKPHSKTGLAINLSSTSNEDDIIDTTPKSIELDRESYKELMADPYCRTLANPKKASVVLIIHQADGAKKAYQYNPPVQEYYEFKNQEAEDIKTIVPKFRPLQSIEEIHPYGLVRYKAMTPGGTVFIGRRSLDVHIEGPEFNNVDGKIVCFSPEPQTGCTYWGAAKKPESIFVLPQKKIDQNEVIKDCEEAGVSFKGGATLRIDPASVPYRKEIKVRKPDQNTVMGQSAVNAYADFLEGYSDVLRDDVRKLMSESVSAPLRDQFYSCKRTEWLHLYGFGLTPKDYSPQVEENLGAAPKWANTEMMVAEYIVQWIAQHVHKNKIAGVEIDITPVFEMILNTEIVKHIDYKTKTSFNNRSIQTHQSIDPFTPLLYRKKCDVAFGSLIVSKVLSGAVPDRVLNVSLGPLDKKNSVSKKK
jgi:hypothetical protein